MPSIGGYVIGGGVSGGGSIAAVSAALAKPWSSGEILKIGAIRTILVGGIRTLLISTSDRTTSGTFDLAELGFWEYYSQNGTGGYPASAIVPLGFQSFINGRLYESNINHVSTATFVGAEVTNWFDQGSVAYSSWIPSEDLKVGAVRRISVGAVDVFLMSKQVRTTGAALNAAELATAGWSYSGQSIVGSFPATTLIPTGFQFRDDNDVPWERTGAAYTSGAAFDLTEASTGWTLLSSDAVEIWAPNKYLRAGELRSITMGGETVYLIATLNHTSSATFDLATMGKLRYVGQSNVGVWSVSQPFIQGFRIEHGAKVYVKNGSDISGATSFDADLAGWTHADGTEAQELPWAPNIYYPAGAARTLTAFGVTSYARCMTAHVGAATFTAAEAANWLIVGGPTATAFAATTVVTAGQLLRLDNRTYRRISSGTTGAAFDTTESALWEVISAVRDSAIRFWEASKLIYPDDVRLFNLHGAVLTLVNSGGLRTTGAAFNAVEAAEWTVLGQSNYPNAYPAAGGLVLSGMVFSLKNVLWRRKLNVAHGLAGASFFADRANYENLSASDPYSTEQVIVTGGAQTITDVNATIYINPATVLAALSLTFPTAIASDRDILRIVFGGTITSGQVVTAITWPADLLSPLPATLVAGDCLIARYSATISKWIAE